MCKHESLLFKMGPITFEPDGNRLLGGITITSIKTLYFPNCQEHNFEKLFKKIKLFKQSLTTIHYVRLFKQGE